MRNRAEQPGLYIHIPFCKTKCPYCDFYSITDPALMMSFVDALMTEARLYRYVLPSFDTLYFGGGTPSLLDDGLFAGLLKSLRVIFSFSPDTEITIEMNPDDVTAEKLELYRSLGVNRVSLGVQSFDEKELVFLKRRHTAEGAGVALELIRATGFTNLGIDLMYGLPGQTEKGWMSTMETACSFNPAHLSCYQLTVAPETPFGKMQEEGDLKLPTEAKQRKFFLKTAEFLERRGFIHYEVSNFARGLNMRSRHNLKYWRHTPYLGLGPAAHSFHQGQRWWNVKSVEEYRSVLEKGERPVEDIEKLTAEQLELERLFLGFRNLEGIVLKGSSDEIIPREALERLVVQGLVIFDGEKVIPTTKGYLIADSLPLMVLD